MAPALVRMGKESCAPSRRVDLRQIEIDVLMLYSPSAGSNAGGKGDANYNLYGYSFNGRLDFFKPLFDGVTQVCYRSLVAQ